MTPVPDKPRASRNRRRDGILGLAVKKLSGAAVVVIGIAVLFNVLIHHLERSPAVHPDYVRESKAREMDVAARARAAEAEFSAHIQGIDDIDSKRPLIEAALHGFFQAKTLEDKLSWSRHPSRVRALMQDYYSRHSFAPQQVTGVGACVSVREKGCRLGYVEALFGKGHSYSIIVEESADGEFRADWESFVRYSEMDWADVLRLRPETPVLCRVLATRHNEKNADSGQQWLELSAPGQAQPAQAFFDPKDPQFQPLLDQLQLGGWKKVPLTLRLCYSKQKSHADAACIVGSEGKGWLILTDRRS